MSKAVGFIDAYQDKVFLEKCFIPTTFYKKSLRDDINFICGRRGSGKSAIVLSLQKDKKYSYKSNVKGHQFYNQFLESVKNYDLQELDIRFVFETIWKHIVLTTAMNAVITTKYPKNSDYISTEDAPIYEYLKNKKFLKNEAINIWQKIINALKETIKRYQGEKTFVAILISEITDILENDDFKLAEKALKSHLNNNGKCLIVVDTILDYFIKQNVFIACVEGLMQATLNLTCQRYHKNLEVKCCIPGEVYPRIRMWEKSKVKDHLTYLQWIPKDLIRMISKRMLFHIVQNGYESFEKFEKINWNRYEEVKKEVWNRYFPEEIINCNEFSEKTHVYLLRHTQHTPREVIRIVNTIIDELEDNIHEHLNKDELREAVIKGIHVSINDTAQELIDSNQYLIKNLEDILFTSFQSKPKISDISEIRKYLTYSKKFWKDYSEVVEEDNIITELFAIGFLGLVLNYSDDSKSIKVKFSYLEPNIGLGKDCKLAIHPLFYEHFNITRKINRFVYPVSSLIDTWSDPDGM